MTLWDFTIFFNEQMRNRQAEIERSIGRLNEPGNENVISIYHMLALDFRTMAVDTLVLGNRDEAIEWLKKSTLYYIKWVESIRAGISNYSWSGEANTCLEYLYPAILSGDVELVRRCAGLVLSIPDAYPAEKADYSQKYLFAVALSSFLMGDIEKSRTTLNALDPSRDKGIDLSIGVVRIKEREAYFEGLKACLGGIVGNDMAGFIDGLRVLLAYHDRHFAGSRSPDALISFDASALVLIARRMGMPVKHCDAGCLKHYTPGVLFGEDAPCPADYLAGQECSVFLIDEVFKRMDELVAEEAYGDLGRYARWAAVFSILQGNRLEALAWFKKSSEYFYDEVSGYRSKYVWKILSSWDGDAMGCIDTLYSAILSGDKGSIDKSIGLSLGILYGKWVAVNYRCAEFYYLKAFSNYLSGDRTKAVNNMEQIIPKKVEKLIGIEDHYRGLQTSLQGLIGNDKDRLVQGLNVLLTHHSHCVRSESPDCLVSIDATVLVRVAREKGIEVKSGDISKGLEKYIPWNLFE